MVGDNWFRKHPIATYLILANGITWLCWIHDVYNWNNLHLRLVEQQHKKRVSSHIISCRG